MITVTVETVLVTSSGSFNAIRVGHWPISSVSPYIYLAISKGVKIFVLLTASQEEIGSPVLALMGNLNLKVHGQR